jgi:hypothetical protein
LPQKLKPLQLKKLLLKNLLPRKHQLKNNHLLNR